MIEEKLTIDFKEYISLINEESAEYLFCMNKINNTVNKFLSGATAVAHHGFNLHGEDFCAGVSALSLDDDGDSTDLISLDITDGSSVSAEFSFDATMKLVMTKTNNCVVIDCE